MNHVSKTQLDEIIRNLGAVIAYYRGALSSRYERTKEVWRALQTLLRLSETKWDEWIPVIVEQNTPNFGSPKDTVYFKQLLKELLYKYAETCRGYSPFTKRVLAKAIRNAVDSASSNPYPEICFFVSRFHPERIKDKRFSSCSEVIDK